MAGSPWGIAETPVAKRDLPLHGSLHAVVDAIADIDIKTPWLTKERLVAGGAAAIAVASGVVLGISLRFHDHAPQQTSIRLAFHQPAANQLRGNELRWTAEEGFREGLGECGGYRNGWRKEYSPTTSKSIILIA